MSPRTSSISSALMVAARCCTFLLLRHLLRAGLSVAKALYSKALCRLPFGRRLQPTDDAARWSFAGIPRVTNGALVFDTEPTDRSGYRPDMDALIRSLGTVDLHLPAGTPIVFSVILADGTKRTGRGVYDPLAGTLTPEREGDDPPGNFLHLSRQVEAQVSRNDSVAPGLGPCECVCSVCQSGDHCDAASCATVADVIPLRQRDTES